jgi:hypothetical protein
MLPQRMTAYTAPEELALDVGSDVDLAGAFAAPLANVTNIVLTHGRLGNRPAIGLETPIPAPKLAPNGKPGIWQLQCAVEVTIGGDHVERIFEAPVQGARRGVYPAGSFCILEYTSSSNFSRASSSVNCASSASSRTYFRRHEAGLPWHLSAYPVQ